MEKSQKGGPVFNRDITMKALLNSYPGLIPLLIRRKLHCVGCPLAAFHGITDAAFEHDQDEDELYEAILEAIGLDLAKPDKPVIRTHSQSSQVCAPQQG